MSIRTPRTRLLVLAVLAFIAAGAAWWLLVARRPAAVPPAAASSPVLEHTGAQVFVPEGSALRRSVVVETASEQTVAVPFSLPAVVEADPARLVKVAPPVAGRVASLDKGLGDAVRTGDVLFRIDSADLAQARSDAQKAGAALALASQALQRQLALGASEIAAQRDIEQARSDETQARGEAARTSTRLAQLGASGNGPGGVLAVRSPASGRVVELAAAQGAFWNDVTAPVLTVADLSTVFVTASAGESELKDVYVGQSVRVALDAYPGDERVGTVRYVGELLDPDTRRVKVRMSFDNRDGRLKPGMFAQAIFAGRPHRGLLLPMAAVVQGGLSARVFVEVAPWRFEPRTVQLGPKIGESIEVASGLKAGERVVSRDGVLLND